ncbi:MAG: hypothetical protein AAGA67_12545 [Cyanobacteria bacterium P01_F01_bin.153]
MDSAGSVPRSEDPPSPLSASLIVNCVGTAIAIVTLSLPTMAVTYYSGEASDAATPDATLVPPLETPPLANP